MLNLKNPDRITSIIPTAKKIEYNGTTLVAIPHRLDEVRVLRNMGIEAPSPARYYYEYPGKFKPLAHQLATVEFLTLHPKSFCLNDMGTMKTISSLWAADYLRATGFIDAVVVIAPLSTIEDTWNNEVFNNFPELTTAVVHGTAERRCKLLSNDDIDVYIINHHGILGAQAHAKLLELMKRRRILLIVDELSFFRNASTKSWKALRPLVEACEWVWGLTGTPTPQDPTDAWAQCKLINPTTVPKFFGAFRDMVMRQLGPYKWVPRENSKETVHRVMQPAIRFARADCVDLPPTTYQTRHVDLSPEQSKVYAELVAKFKAEFAGGQITAINEAAKRSKILQCAVGAVYGDGEDAVIVPAQARIDLVAEIVEQSEAKVIVFVPFRGALENLAEELRKKFGVSVIHGGVSKTKRDAIFADFRRADGARVLVADARTMSHGLNLTVANTVVWFGPAPSNEVYEQANARVPRPGQKLNTFIIHIEGSPVERISYERLQNRSKSQGLLLDMFAQQ